MALELTPSELQEEYLKGDVEHFLHHLTEDEYEIVWGFLAAMDKNKRDPRRDQLIKKLSAIYEDDFLDMIGRIDDLAAGNNCSVDDVIHTLDEAMNPIQDFLDGLSNEETRVLWAYMSSGSDRDMGAMMALRKAFKEEEFQGFFKKLDTLTRKVGCPIEELKFIIGQRARGEAVKNKFLRFFYSSKEKKNPNELDEDALQEEVDELVRAKAALKTRQKAGLALRAIGWLHRLLGTKT